MTNSSLNTDEACITGATFTVGTAITLATTQVSEPHSVHNNLTTLAIRTVKCRPEIRI